MTCISSLFQIEMLLQLGRSATANASATQLEVLLYKM